MQISADVIKLLLRAGVFSQHELDVVCRQAFGSSLDSVLQASTGGLGLTDAIVEYAFKFNLVEPLVEHVLEGGASRPGLQNLLLGGEMPDQASAGGNLNFELLRIISRLDLLATELAAVKANQVAMQSELSALRTSRNSQAINWNIIALAFVIAAFLTALIYVVPRIGI